MSDELIPGADPAPSGDPATASAASDNALPVGDPQPAREATTILTGDPAPDTGAPAADTDWRQKLSGGDEKKQKLLGRYASEQAVVDALVAANTRISKGDIGAQPPGEGASEEEVSAYRESIGVPNDSGDYFKELSDGIVIGEDDKEMFGSFADVLQKNNIPQAAAQDIAEWYYNDVVEAQEQAVYDANREAQLATRDALKEEYGQEFNAQTNGIQNLLNSLPNGAGEILASATDTDGISIFNNVEVVRAFAQLSNELNPAGSVIPGVTNMQGLTERKAELKQIMANDRQKWHNSPELQEEYMKILDAEEKMAG